jgi:3-oxoacyl-(acyl-carrier-protein) synthase
MEATSIPCPDAILAGTSFGCVENTELFLEAMTYEGEECLKPTSFMQSTHNTIASMIAIETQCHGYNSTYTNKGTSFDCALADAFLRLQSKFISNALVGGYDELTPHYYNMLSRIGYIGETSGTLCGESAVSMMLTVNNNEKRALCRLNAIEMYYGSNIEELRQALQRLLQASNCRLNNIDAVMTGINGNPLNDKTYNEVCQALFPNTHILIYKNIFGEIRTSSALGLYAAAKCISQHKIPPFMSLAGNTQDNKTINADHILFYNQCEGKTHSLILLSSC